MVDINDLFVGAIVRLASGSPKMTVVGFSTAAPAARGEKGRRIEVRVLLWSDRQGFVRADLPPQLLVYPRPAAAGPEEAA